LFPARGGLGAAVKSTMKVYALAWVAVAAACAGACSSVWGFDDLVAGDAGSDGSASEGGSGSGSGSSSGSGGSSGGSAPDAGAIVAPPGWTLVEAAFSASTPPACGAAWATDDTILYDGIDAPAATCGCSCGAPSGVACAFPVDTCTVSGGICQGCGSTPTNISSAACVGGSYQSAGAPTASGGACTASPSTSAPPLSWAGQVRLCTQTAAVPPVPDPSFTVCVEQVGAQTCPGLFPSRHLEYTGADDARSCSACTCGSPSGVNCGGSWSLYTDGSCQTFFHNYGLSFGQCTSYGTSGGSSMYQAAPSGGSCTAATVAPTGSALATGAVTICCR
jgi:hypothetical protein